MLITDGRGHVERTLPVAFEMLPTFEQYVVVDDREHELGFAGAIAEGWSRVETDFVLHLEDDFLIKEPVPLGRMIDVLEAQPNLAQLVLKRQPWNAEEREAGGIVELHPDDFRERSNGADLWTEHRRFWSTNPSIYSSRWCERGWPQESHSEGLFTHRLLEDPEVRFAFWGAKFDSPLVEHIGVERAGHGY